MGKSTGCETLHLRVLVAVVVAHVCCCVSADYGERQADEIILEHEQIFVNLEDGQGATLSLMVDSSDSVRDLLIDISEREGVPGDRMHLQLAGTWLDAKAKLSDYSIRSGGPTLALVVPQDDSHCKTVEFTVETRDGRELPVASQLGNTVSSLKDTIAARTGIQPTQQRLLLKGKELKDERKLIHYGVYNGSRVKLGQPLEDCRRRAVRILVKTLSGARLQVELDLADTVDDLKEKIWTETGVPVGVQRLFFNEQVIAGKDHLCDLELEANSTVYMLLYSSRITSLDQVARLRPPVACPVESQRKPIFREAEDVGEPEHPVRSLYKDARNWMAASNRRPGWTPGLFDPMAELPTNPDSEASMRRDQQALENRLRPEASESDRLEAAILRARIKLCSALRPYRVAANLTSLGLARPGITLAGGLNDEKYPLPLGADINNWAPDAFSDADVMRLFEVSERVRRLLAESAQTGAGTLGVASQKRINRAILMTYLAALAGYQPSVGLNQTGEDVGECGVCRDDLRAKSAIMLPCEHTFHADCIHSWVRDLYQERGVPSCPFCRRRFTFPYEAQGRAELQGETPRI